MGPLPFSRAEFLEVFASFNTAAWPFVVALWILSAWMCLEYARVTDGRPRLAMATLTVLWAFGAVVYHAAFFSSINPAAWLFAGLFAIQSGLFAWHGLIRGTFQFAERPSRIRRLSGTVLIVYALIYPALAVAEGHAYPRVPTFGVPCPTTILTIGVLIAAAPDTPVVLMLIPIVWAAIGGSAAFLLGVRTDFMLLVAGIALTSDALRRVHARLRTADRPLHATLRPQR
jgi:hypothetical protein